MNIQTNISTPGLFTILFIVISLAIVYVIYFFKKNKDEFTPFQRYLLGGIKFVYLILVALLLLSPLFEIIKDKIEKPLLIVGIDNSESMNADQDNKEFISNYLSEIKTELGNKFQIETLLFGNKTIKNDSINFSELKSNYSNFLNDVKNRYFNLNVGAAILIGDGIYNEGKNPEQNLDKIDFPIFTIGAGDTLTKIDQAIIDVTHNPNVFLGNSFPVEVEVTFTDFPQSNTQLSIFLDGKLVKSENIEVLQPNYYYRNIYSISANEVGLKKINVVVSPISNEQNKQNNKFNFTIEVHDNKNELLILSQGPHPDIGALTETLNRQANFNITSTDVSLFNGNLEDYNLVILNQLPSLMSQKLNLFDELKTKNIPVLIIIGPKTSIAALNNLDLKFSLKPSLLNEESSPYFNEAYSLFSLPDNISDIEEIYPPLLTHFTEYTFSSEYTVLAFQKIKGIEMNYPLIITGEIDNRKVGVIMGEGIWRWRLKEYQNYNNQNVFNQITVNLFNYLCLKVEREQFKIIYERIAAETSPVEIKAQLFNEIYESVNNSEIKFTLIDSAGSELSYLFDANQTEYNLNLGFLSPGNYSFKAETNLGEELYSKQGSFSVQEVNIEQQNLKSNFKTLKLLSLATGGEFYLKNQNKDLLITLNESQNIQAKIHKEKNIHELIDLKWYILAILLLLILEWFLRKFWGSY